MLNTDLHQYSLGGDRNTYLGWA